MGIDEVYNPTIKNVVIYVVIGGSWNLEFFSKVSVVILDLLSFLREVKFYFVKNVNNCMTSFPLSFPEVFLVVHCVIFLSPFVSPSLKGVLFWSFHIFLPIILFPQYF